MAESDCNFASWLRHRFRNLFGPSHLRGQDPLGCSRLTWWANYELTDCTDYDVGSHTNSFLLSSYGIEQASLSLL